MVALATWAAGLGAGPLWFLLGLAALAGVLLALRWAWRGEAKRETEADAMEDAFNQADLARRARADALRRADDPGSLRADDGFRRD